MPSLNDLGFTQFQRREVVPIDINEEIVQAQQILPEAGIDYNQLNIDVFQTNQNMQSNNFVSGVAGWQLTGAGILTAVGVVLSGSITATTGQIGGWTIAAAEISSGNVKIQSTAERILLGSATEPLTGVGIFIGKDSSDYELRLGDPDNAYFHYDGTNITLTGGIVQNLATGSEVAIQSWTFSGDFSVTDLNTIAWSSGTLTFLNGATYAIDAGNTSNMAAFNYIYLDLAVSTTVLQVNAAFTAGSGKVLIAVAQNGTSEASYLLMGGSGDHNLDGSTIAAGSIIANRLAVSQLSAITADMGSITAGDITVSAAGFIKAGQTAYNTGSGYWLGYDTDAYKLSIGSSTNNITWDGTDLKISGRTNLNYYLVTADEPLSDGDAVSVVPAGEDIFGDTGDQSQTVNEDQYPTTPNNAAAQSFTMGDEFNYLTSIDISVHNSINNGINYDWNLYASDANDKPTGASLKSGSFSWSSVADHVETLTIDLDVTAGAKYVLVVDNGVGGGTAYWNRSSGDEYAGGRASTSSDGGSNWTNQNTDMYFTTTGKGTSTAGRIVQADASADDYRANNFIGFIQEALDYDEEGTCILVGLVSNLAGLTLGTTYYLSDTAGAISSNTGTQTRKIGISTSATELLIKHENY